jgi:hypothetical protein
MPSTIRSTMLLLSLVASCDDDGDPVLPDASTVIRRVRACVGDPQPGEYAAWDIQLAAPFDATGRARCTSGSVGRRRRSIDYGSGVTVTPDGPIAGRVAAQTRSPIPFVVCHIDTGAIALDDPAMLFPAGVIGGDAGCSATSIPAPMLARCGKRSSSRFEHAKTLGCDTVDAPQ